MQNLYAAIKTKKKNEQEMWKKIQNLHAAQTMSKAPTQSTKIQNIIRFKRFWSAAWNLILREKSSHFLKSNTSKVLVARKHNFSMFIVHWSYMLQTMSPTTFLSKSLQNCEQTYYNFKYAIETWTENCIHNTKLYTKLLYKYNSRNHFKTYVHDM